MKTSMQKLVSESLAAQDVIPPGFRTISEWAADMPELAEFRPNTARTKLAPILDQLVKERKVKRQKFYVRRGPRLIAVDHYRTL